MNMTVETYGDTTGSLEVNKFGYQLTNSALKHWDYDMVDGVTVKMVEDVVYGRGRDKYQFSGEAQAVGIGGKICS
jgi:hypothetical protein